MVTLCKKWRVSYTEARKLVNFDYDNGDVTFPRQAQYILSIRFFACLLLDIITDMLLLVRLVMCVKHLEKINQPYIKVIVLT